MAFPEPAVLRLPIPKERRKDAPNPKQMADSFPHVSPAELLPAGEHRSDVLGIMLIKTEESHRVSVFEAPELQQFHYELDRSSYTLPGVASVFETPAAAIAPVASGCAVGLTLEPYRGGLTPSAASTSAGRVQALGPPYSMLRLLPLLRR